MKGKNRCLSALVYGLILIACGWATTVGADEATDTTLRTALDQLVESVRGRDDAGIDAAACLDLLAPAYVQRQARLGLLPDAGTPAPLDQFRQKYRTAVYKHFDDLLRRGRQIVDMDTSRVQTRAPGDAKNETLLVPENSGKAVSEIITSGIVGVKLHTSQRMIDIDVSRIGDRWCLNPVSIQ